MKKRIILKVLPFYFALVPLHDFLVQMNPSVWFSFWKEIIVWSLFALLAILHINRIKFSKKFELNFIVIYTIVITFFVILMSFVNSNRDTLLKIAGLIKMFGYFPLYIIVPMYLRYYDESRLWKPLLVVTTILGALAILEVFAGVDFASEKSVRDFGAGFRRAQVTIGSPLSYGLLTAIAIYLSIFLKDLRKSQKIFYIAFSLIGLVLSLSRGAWIFLLIAVLFNVIFLKYDSARFKFVVFSGIMLIVIFSVSFVNTSYFQQSLPARTIERVMGTFSFESTSNALRIIAWTKCISMVHENPFFGSGLGSILPTMPSLGYYSYFSPESQWLKFMVEFGLIGTTLLALSFLYPRNFKVPLYGPLIVAFVVEMIWLQSLDSYLINILFWSFLGIVHRECNKGVKW